MCGIFGWFGNSNNVSYENYLNGIKRLFILSETRGKEASGICTVNADKISVYRDNIRAKNFIISKNFTNIVKEMFEDSNDKNYFSMGHARMVTNGDSSISTNNQPVIKNNLVCIHNGIIVNDDKIWENHEELQRQYEVDTEVLLALIESYKKQGLDLLQAFQKSMQEIEGSVSISLLSKDTNVIILYTNVGSLYYCMAKDKKQIIFASERYILEEFIRQTKNSSFFEVMNISQIQACQGKVISLESLEIQNFCCESSLTSLANQKKYQKEIKIYASEHSLIKNKNINVLSYYELDKLMTINEEPIRKLKRCRVCLLPETFPGIEFDESGKCSMCGGYHKKGVKGKEELKDVLGKESVGSNYSCIMPISGGRDSCYSLHYAVEELGLKVVAYTYDWGLVTDLARRNIQRMCSKLKVEHILVSADIAKKRNNVKMNVDAWLKSPNIATIPLFMAGDKQFFYYAQLLKKQTKAAHILFGQNSLEETNFKVAFTGIKDKQKGTVYYDLSKTNKAKLCLYYGKEFIKNPAFINSSMIDSFGGFCSYYMLPKDYIQIFDYIQWKQKEVEDTIINNYGWELATDTDETWRIGDGTAAFYNYIYYRVCGFSEFDTFKSNQIREGMITREEAIKSIYNSNAPRIESFKWYCDTIGIDAIKAVKIINAIKTRY